VECYHDPRNKAQQERPGGKRGEVVGNQDRNRKRPAKNFRVHTVKKSKTKQEVKGRERGKKSSGEEEGLSITVERSGEAGQPTPRT
jgi:hypothetical protein